MIEHKAGIIDSVQSYLNPHVLDHDALTRSHLIIPDPYYEGVNSFGFAADRRLSEHYGVVGMAGPIRDPELLAERRRRINRELLLIGVVDGRSFHLGRIITIAKLSEAEAAHVLEGGDIAHEGQVTFRV